MTLDIRREYHVDDVVQLIEADLAGAAAINAGGRRRLRCGDTAVQSAFRPVGKATTTSRSLVELEDSTVDVDDDEDTLVVVSKVLRDVMLPGSSQQLLPGDILLEVHHYSCDRRR